MKTSVNGSEVEAYDTNTEQCADVYDLRHDHPVCSCRLHCFPGTGIQGRTENRNG